MRVTGKSRDDLQAAIALVRGGNLGRLFQFKNFRDWFFPPAAFPHVRKVAGRLNRLRRGFFRLCGLVIQRLNQRLLFRSWCDTQSVKNIPNLIKLLITGVVLAGNRRLRG